MVYFVHSHETASSNIADALRGILGLRESASFHGLPHFCDGNIHMLKINGRLIEADFLESMIDDRIVFLSRHSSNKGVPAFTVHAEGNWNEDNSLGGRPNELSVSSPTGMLDTLHSINSLNSTGIQVTYEATHHGPFLSRPSFFVELGGNEETIANKDYARIIANAVAKSIDANVHYDKIAVGIGGTHYPEKFTRLALEGKYAFAHIMSRHHVGNTYMIKQAFERSDSEPELAVIEWKSIKAAGREMILRELSSLGIDYAKV